MADDFFEHPNDPKFSLRNRHIVQNEWTLVTIKRFIKQFLKDHTNIITPEVYKYFSKHEVRNLKTDIFDGLPNRFVIKPNALSGGRGVYNLRTSGNYLIEPNGNAWSRKGLLKAMWDVYTENEHPSVGTFFEETITSHPKLNEISDYNEFVELRNYFIKGKHIETLLKIPSKASAGYSNGCKGAYRVTAVDGVVCPSKHFRFDNTAIDGESLNGFTIPNWDNVIEGISVIPKLFRTQFLTVDGTINQSGDFVVTEFAIGPSMPFSKEGKERWRKYKTGLSKGKSVAEQWMEIPRCPDCAIALSEGQNICEECLYRRQANGLKTN